MRWRSIVTNGPCNVRSSNAAHCLFTGIVTSPERARRMCSTLMDDASFAGWGIRTVAAGEAAVQPDVVPQRVNLAA